MLYPGKEIFCDERPYDRKHDLPAEVEVHQP